MIALLCDTCLCPSHIPDMISCFSVLVYTRSVHKTLHIRLSKSSLMFRPVPAVHRAGNIPESRRLILTPII